MMWDSEGKDVDTNVVRKLFSPYPEYFQKNVIGEDIFLTYRIPTPRSKSLSGILSRPPLTQSL